MIDFHKVELSDITWIKKHLSAKKDIGCEYSFGNIFSYDKKVNVTVADVEECLVIRTNYMGEISYLYPIGQGDEKKALLEIEKDALERNIKCRIVAMNNNDKEVFKQLFGEKYTVYAARDTFDYVYNSDDLINLRGKKYQPKRNHISFFKKNYNWSYETITSENIPECIEMSEQWLENSTQNKDDLSSELEIINFVFENYFQLGYVGGLIRIDGKVVAYTMGEPLNEDMFCVHFEKAFSDIRGAYPIINQQFVQNELSSYKYINREDDVGLENLRKAKCSYHPAFLLEKYEAIIID